MFEKLIDFRNIPLPSADVLAKRDEQIAELKKQLGHKYLLSKPMPKIN